MPVAPIYGLPNGSVVVLASGGIDSTAVMRFYLQRKSDIRVVFVDYGQPSAQAEENSLKHVARHYSLDPLIIRLGTTFATRRSEYLGRNAILLFLASTLGDDPSKIAMGIRSDSPYYDCSPMFMKTCQMILDGYFGGTVRFEAPFLEFNKKAIIRYCKKERVPLRLTYSCTQGNSPCGKCPSCIDRTKYLEM